ncbi:glycosyltransferase family 1 protein [Synechococcus sp. CS-602]|uniref:glycosyltransferase family 4 protein n=1 Tax=Synechococcaceae TaxID=1890426 RepID=UPI0008FF48D3|nr:MULTISPECIES: glycosyltransferase family 1 protein [Synechococcaceae]MCT4364818.1 glycosyltransferase family 1 protein [Candidatus Regnicoccus frigidus MAG-AL1]APD49421.1 glycosyl transferase [Synechococcus sp. SynAce01]MCT0203322.1 glycosyltransferase family 1 protein [Synechococcus sp. CS-603]MCT0203970.1 glycosyltransferase family 1 protein [Synechococcus sp. CS-602]MCT0246542.1 glycosyltransferase family 1 protein [Synechococcus sp. CS-601]
MKIVFFTETFLPKVDGIVTRLTKTVEHLVAAGEDVLVFCPEGGPDTYMGARVIGVPAMPLPLYPELKLALPRPAVAEALEAFAPDLVHVVNPAVLGLGGIWLAKSRQIPLVASYHTHLPKYLEHYGVGLLEPLLWELLKAAHNQAELNLCTSTAMVEELSQRGIQHTALWQRGVDTELFRPELRNPGMRRTLMGQHADSDSLLLYVGRLSAEKQIERIRPVLDAMPQARLALVGDGPHRQQLEKVFAGSATTFLGYMAGEELASAYASADAFLFPSSTETLGLVLLEAMAAGCPVVGANRGGIPDIVTDGVNGCLYDPDEPSSLASATARLLASPQRREELRLAARSEAERWGWAAATDQLRGFYRQVSRPKLQLVG